MNKLVAQSRTLIGPRKSVLNAVVIEARKAAEAHENCLELCLLLRDNDCCETTHGAIIRFAPPLVSPKSN